MSHEALNSAQFKGLGADKPGGMAPFASDEERKAYFERPDVKKIILSRGKTKRKL